MHDSEKLLVDFSRGCAGRRIPHSFLVTHPPTLPFQIGATQDGRVTAALSASRGCLLRAFGAGPNGLPFWEWENPIHHMIYHG